MNTLDNLDIYLTLSAYAFVIGLPCLGTELVILSIESRNKSTVKRWYYDFLATIAGVAPVLGLILFMAHISIPLAAVFFFTGVVACLIGFRMKYLIEKQD